MVMIGPPAPAENAAVAALVAAAFGQPDEACLVGRLRAAGRIFLELVAREADLPVGHIAFSPAGIGAADGDGRWWALAPLAVAPDRQRQGIGTALVRTGLDAAWRQGAGLVIVLGEPAYYGRFGFGPAGSLGLTCPFPAPAECFMALGRGPAPPAGIVRYVKEFDGS